jgi:hypothetical protein
LGLFWWFRCVGGTRCTVVTTHRSYFHLKVVDEKSVSKCPHSFLSIVVKVVDRSTRRELCCVNKSRLG